MDPLICKETINQQAYNEKQNNTCALRAVITQYSLAEASCVSSSRVIVMVVMVIMMIMITMFSITINIRRIIFVSIVIIIHIITMMILRLELLC